MIAEAFQWAAAGAHIGIALFLIIKLPYSGAGFAFTVAASMLAGFSVYLEIVR